MEVARKSASGQRLSWRSDKEADTLGSSSQDTVGCIYPREEPEAGRVDKGTMGSLQGQGLAVNPKCQEQKKDQVAVTQGASGVNCKPAR